MNKIIVKKGKEKRIVQRSMIPEGFTYVEDYKDPKKVTNKKKTAKKPIPKREQPKKEAKK